MSVKIVYCNSDGMIELPKKEFEEILNEVEQEAFNSGLRANANSDTKATRVKTNIENEDMDTPMLANNVDPDEMEVNG